MDMITVQGWPTNTQCLAWSDDGQLAVGLGEHIAVLVPNLKSFEHDKKSFSDVLFHHVIVRVNTFTTDEIPTRGPTDWRSWSIGDEIGQNTVVSIAWSLPGLGKHQNCALAILTANCALSIWASGADPKVMQSWKRVNVINHALNHYFLQSAPSSESRVYDRDQGKKLRLQRIRAFAWIHSTMSGVRSSGIWSSSSQIIAVSNDCNDILFVEIISPYDRFTKDNSEYTTLCVGRFSFGNEISSGIPFTFEDFIQEQRYASNLAWTSCRVAQSGAQEGFLAFNTRSGLHVKVITFIKDNTDASPQLGVFDMQSRVEFDFSQDSGPLFWLPSDGVNKEAWVIFDRTEVLSLSFDLTSRLVFLKERRKIQSLWDQLAGIAVSCGPSDSLILNAVPHLSSLNAADSGLKIPLHSTEIASTPPWQVLLRDVATSFSNVHGLVDNILLKVWGLAVSPLGNTIAVASTSHPSNMIEYTIFAEQRITISFSDSVVDDGPILFPTGSEALRHGQISAEILLMSIKYYLRRYPELANMDDAFMERIWAPIVRNLETEKTTDGRENIHIEEVAQADKYKQAQLFCAHLRSAIFASRESKMDRLSHLVSMIRAPTPPKDNSMDSVAMAISTHLFEYLSDFLIISNLSSAVMGQINLITGVNGDATPTSVENCEICNSVILLDNRLWAKCINGHQFVRCGLTFLAIQAPGISKQCGICKKQYFNDDYIFNQEAAFAATLEDAGGAPTGSLRDGERRLSLAEAIFAACHLCVYCGGKFVG